MKFNWNTGKYMIALKFYSLVLVRCPIETLCPCWTFAFDLWRGRWWVGRLRRRTSPPCWLTNRDRPPWLADERDSKLECCHAAPPTRCGTSCAATSPCGTFREARRTCRCSLEAPPSSGNKTTQTFFDKIFSSFRDVLLDRRTSAWRLERLPVVGDRVCAIRGNRLSAVWTLERCVASQWRVIAVALVSHEFALHAPPQPIATPFREVPLCDVFPTTSHLGDKEFEFPFLPAENNTMQGEHWVR